MYEIVVCRISCGRSPRQRGRSGFALEPKHIHATGGGHKKGIVEYSYIADGILQVDVCRYVDTRIAIEEIIEYRSIGDHSTVLTPHMQTIMVIGIGSVIPVRVAMDVVVVDAESGCNATGSERKPMIDIVDI